jgi:hypothetical protein
MQKTIAWKGTIEQLAILFQALNSNKNISTSPNRGYLKAAAYYLGDERVFVANQNGLRDVLHKLKKNNLENYNKIKGDMQKLVSSIPSKSSDE